MERNRAYGNMHDWGLSSNTSKLNLQVSKHTRLTQHWFDADWIPQSSLKQRVTLPQHSMLRAPLVDWSQSENHQTIICDITSHMYLVWMWLSQILTILRKGLDGFSLFAKLKLNCHLRLRLTKRDIYLFYSLWYYCNIFGGMTYISVCVGAKLKVPAISEPALILIYWMHVKSCLLICKESDKYSVTFQKWC
jgi:hypothetical protein